MNNIIGLDVGSAIHIGDDDWTLVEKDQDIVIKERMIIPFRYWKQEILLDDAVASSLGVLLDPDEEPEVLSTLIDKIPLIALQFKSFRDGRAYSQANLLRTRYQYKGDIRAVGDVLRDQLGHMRHCGFSSFAIRQDKSVLDALKGLADFDMIYARSVKNPEPLFRRRNRNS